MSTLRNRAKAIFQKPPCDENNYISFSDEYGCVIVFPPPRLGPISVDEARAKWPGYDKAVAHMLDYDAQIKKVYGPEHFHGEEGVHLALGVRMGLGMS